MHTARGITPFLCLPLVFAISSALAQETSDDDVVQGTLEEVMVTASRRGDQDIMTTPVSISALNGEDTEKFAIRDLNDIAVSIPGLSSGTVSAFKSAQFAMRGVSESTIILYKESPVGVTIDEFVVPHVMTSNLEMYDIETIEVLRGPQGTLFGKNTTGGVINVRTKRPVLEENSVDARMQFGEFGTNKFMGALNLSAGDNLAFRIAGMHLKSDGYYKNGASWSPLGQSGAPFNTVDHLGSSGQGDGGSLGGDDLVSGRVKMLWSPTDSVNLLFQYEYLNDDGDTPPLVQTSGPGYLVPLWGFDTWTPALGDPLDFAGVTPRCDPEPAGICMADGHRIDIDGYYLNGDWAINDNYTLYFNAGRREQESRLPNAYVGNPSPYSVFDATRDDNRETSQVEVRLGSNLGGSFDFTAGVFYQEDSTIFSVMQYVGFFDGFFVGTPPDYWNNFPRVLSNKQDAEAQAAYIDGTWQVTDRFQVTGGFRYTQEDKAWAGRPMRQMLDGQWLLDILNEPLDAADFARFPDGVVYDDHDWSEPTYRLILGYDFSDDTYGFFGYSRGFKSGGYNDQIGTTLDPITELAAQPTDPEIADSWEGGVKHTFADGAATVAVNAYYVQYTDAQRTFNVSFPSGGQETLFFNAAELDVKGIEAEGAWAVNDRLTLTYNASWMDAKFGKFEADTDYDGVIDIDLSGQPVTRAPEWMGSVDATYVQPFNDTFNIEWRGRVSYEDDSIQAYSDVAPEFNTVLEARTLVDASITFTDPDDRWYVRLLGSNLLDERYKTGSLSVATLWVMSAYAPPRYYGIEFGAFMDW